MVRPETGREGEVLYSCCVCVRVRIEFTALVRELQPVNLGQGMPDYSPPQFVLDALAKSTETASNSQYTRGPVSVAAFEVDAAAISVVVIARMHSCGVFSCICNHPQGHPRLVKVLGELYSKVYGRTIDPNNEV